MPLTPASKYIHEYQGNMKTSFPLELLAVSIRFFRALMIIGIKIIHYD